MKKENEKIDFEISELANNIGTFPIVGEDVHFPLVGQLVLVTTVNRDNIANVAPKSWISVFASKPAIVGFGCNMNHDTAKNILSTGEFAVNIPGAELAKKIWKAAELEGTHKDEIKKIGLTQIKSKKISSPRIAECKAHLECALDWTKKYGDQVIIFGRVLLASIDKQAAEGELEDRYKYLKIITHLDENAYGVIKEAKRVKP